MLSLCEAKNKLSEYHRKRKLKLKKMVIEKECLISLLEVEIQQNKEIIRGADRESHMQMSIINNLIRTMNPFSKIINNIATTADNMKECLDGSYKEHCSSLNMLEDLKRSIDLFVDRFSINHLFLVSQILVHP